MRKSILKKTTAIALVLVFSLMIVGCTTTEKKTTNRNLTTNVKDSLVDFSTYRNSTTTDIYAWRGPTDLSDEQWTLLKESGINTLIIDSTIDGKHGATFGVSTQESYMQKCYEYGINAIGYTVGNLDTNIKDYSDKDFYNIIKGIDYTDEPSITEFDDIATVIPDFVEKYPGRKLFICMLSSGSDTKYLGTTDYREYINSWYDTVLSQLPNGMPRVLATDIYPLHSDEKYGYQYLTETWLRSLAYLGKMKKTHPELIMHMAMQSMSFGYSKNTSTRRLPSKTNCLFQVYLNMAFGSTEFSWFTFSTPPIDENEFGEEHLAMIDRSENKTSTYDAVKNANELIYSLDEVMQHITWQGVYPLFVSATTNSEKMDEKAFRHLKSVSDVILDVSDFNVVDKIAADSNVIVSQFMGEKGNECYMLVNYGDPSYNKSVNIEMTFIDCNKAIVYRNGVDSTEKINNNTLHLSLTAGEGILVIPYLAS